MGPILDGSLVLGNCSFPTRTTSSCHHCCTASQQKWTLSHDALALFCLVVKPALMNPTDYCEQMLDAPDLQPGQQEPADPGGHWEEYLTDMPSDAGSPFLPLPSLSFDEMGKHTDTPA